MRKNHLPITIIKTLFLQLKGTNRLSFWYSNVLLNFRIMSSRNATFTEN